MKEIDITQKYLKVYDIILDHLRAEATATDTAGTPEEAQEHHQKEKIYQNLFDEIMQKLEGI